MTWCRNTNSSFKVILNSCTGSPLYFHIRRFGNRNCSSKELNTTSTFFVICIVACFSASLVWSVAPEDRTFETWKVHGTSSNGIRCLQFVTPMAIPVTALPPPTLRPPTGRMNVQVKCDVHDRYRMQVMNKPQSKNRGQRTDGNRGT